jgi:hypothetical protein
MRWLDQMVVDTYQDQVFRVHSDSLSPKVPDCQCLQRIRLAHEGGGLN